MIADTGYIIVQTLAGVFTVWCSSHTSIIDDSPMKYLPRGYCAVIYRYDTFNYSGHSGAPYHMISRAVTVVPPIT